MLLIICLVIAAWIVALFTVPYEKWPWAVPYIGRIVVSGEHPTMEDCKGETMYVFEWFNLGMGIGVGAVDKQP